MKAAIMPGFSELIIRINPTEQVTRESLLTIIMPWLYAPWPEAQKTGIAEIEVEGETLRELLTKLAELYKQVNVELDIINPKTNDLDADYDVLVNGRNYMTLPHGLGTKLKSDDEVRLKILWRWDG